MPVGGGPARRSCSVPPRRLATPTSCSSACRRPRATTAAPTCRTSRQAARQIAPVLKPGCGRRQQVDGSGRLDASSSSGRCNAATCSSCPTPSSCVRERRSRDFLHPDRVVIGSADRRAAERVADLYAGIDATDPDHRPGVGRDDQVRRQRVPGDEDLVRQRRRRDVRGRRRRRRRGRRRHRFRPSDRPAVPQPGPGWGGSCFPKDSRALVKIAEEHGYNFSMMRGVIDVNDEQLERMVDKIAARSAGPSPAARRRPRRRHGRRARPDVQGRHRRPPRIAGAGDHRRAPSARGAGGRVRPDRPPANSSPHQAGHARRHRTRRRHAGRRRRRRRDRGVHRMARVRQDRPGGVGAATVRPGTTIVDTRNLLDPVLVREAGFEYDGVGRR